MASTDRSEAVPAEEQGRFGVDTLMIAVALVWGINAPVVKAALGGWDELAFNAIRFGVAALLIFGYVVLTDRQWRLSRKDLLHVALLGLVGNGLYQYLFVEAIAHSTASNTTLLIDLSPLVVTLWGAAAGLDRLTGWVMAGTAVSVAGVCLVVLGEGGGVQFGSATLGGDLIALAAMLCWAAYTVYAKPVITRVGSSLKVTAWAMLFGGITNLVLGLPVLLHQDYSLITVKSIAGMTYSSLFSLVFSYIVYAWAVKRVGGARTAIYLNLTPIFAAAVAWMFLGEHWTVLQWLGAVLVIVGMTVAKLENAKA